MSAILPGATIGFLGGGQLGRMTALVARAMGYDVQALDPEAACAMRPVSSRTLTTPFTDVAAAIDLASQCDVVTLEIEQIHPDVLDAVAARTPLRPGRAPVWIIQQRARQKQWLADQGFPVGAFRVARDAAAVADAVRDFGPAIAKSVHGGYDGRGQVRLANPAEAASAWQALNGSDRHGECLVEQRLDLAEELSVLVARRPSGETAVYPPSRNHHTQGILTWAVTPPPVDATRRDATMALARRIADSLDVVGLLAVELFVTTDGRLLVNELAPRPHNTFHHSERAFATGQFEQLVRAVCDLPLGSTAPVAPAAIVNLLGEVWLQGEAPNVTGALEVPGTRLHLYGKAGARAGRKMGHLSAIGDSAQEALNRALLAYRTLSPATVGLFDVHPPILGA